MRDLRDIKKGELYDYLTPTVPAERQPSATERWYVAPIRGGTERKAIDFLRERTEWGLYLPRTRVWRSVAKRHQSHAQRKAGANVKRPVEVPVYPGYLFLRFDANRGGYLDIFDRVGINGLVSDGDGPTVIRDSEIERVRCFEGDDGVIPGTVPMAKLLFSIGEKVRVTDGPMRGFDAVIERLPVDMAKFVAGQSVEELDDSMRATIAVNIFGRPTPIHLAMTQFEKL